MENRKLWIGIILLLAVLGLLLYGRREGSNVDEIPQVKELENTWQIASSTKEGWNSFKSEKYNITFDYPANLMPHESPSYSEADERDLLIRFSNFVWDENEIYHSLPEGDYFLFLYVEPNTYGEIPEDLINFEIDGVNATRLQYTSWEDDLEVQQINQPVEQTPEVRFEKDGLYYELAIVPENKIEIFNQILSTVKFLNSN